MEELATMTMELRFFNKRQNDLVHSLVGVRAGWRHENIGERGIAHFLEHAIVLGNEKVSPEIVSSKFGVQVSAMTNPESTLFWYTSLKKDFAEIFELLLSMVFHPSFNNDAILKEKRAKIAPAIVHEADFTDWELGFEWAMNLIFDWNFLQSLGTEEDVNSLSENTLKSWHRRFFGSPNCFALLGGDINQNEVCEIIEDADVPKKVETPNPSEYHWNRKEVLIERRQSQNTEVVYGFKLPHYEAGYEILNVLLGRHPSGRLWQNSFTELAFTVTTKLEWTNTSGALLINLGSSSYGNLDEIDQRLWRLLTDFDVTDAQVEAAKKAVMLKMLQTEEEGLGRLLDFVKHPTNFKYKNMLTEIERVDRVQIKTLAETILIRQNAVRVAVGRLR